MTKGQFKKLNKTYMLCGYYGYKNAGDDSLLNAVINDIKDINPDNKLILLTKNKSEYNFDVNKVIDRFNIAKIIKAMKHTDVLVMGGGSLLQDETSSRSLYYYLLIMYIAYRFDKKIYLYSNGIGPINREINQKLTAKVLSRTSYITLRDKESAKLLKRIGVEGPEIFVTADSVFTLFDHTKIDSKRKEVAIIVRRWHNFDKIKLEIARYCDFIVETLGYRVVFIPLKSPDDVIASNEVRALMMNKSKIIKIDDMVYKNRVLARTKFSVSMRFHGVIYSAAQGVLSIGLSYDKKVKSGCKSLGLQYIDIKELDYKKMIEETDKLLSNYDKRTDKLIKKVDEQKKKARVNKEIFYILNE